MGQNTKFKDQEDFGGFRSSAKSAKFKNQMKERKRLEKEARKRGISVEEYIQLLDNEA